MSRGSLRPSISEAKNGAVVASVAMPVGTMTPARPLGPGEPREQFREKRVGVDVAAPGQRKASAFLGGDASENRRRFGDALGRLKFLVERCARACQAAPSRPAISFRAPPRWVRPRFLRLALAKNSCSCKLDPLPRRIAEHDVEPARRDHLREIRAASGTRAPRRRDPARGRPAGHRPCGRRAPPRHVAVVGIVTVLRLAGTPPVFGVRNAAT